MRATGIFDILLAMGRELSDYIRPKHGKPHIRNYGRVGGGRMRGVGYTRKNKEESKARRKMAARSRRINRLRV